MKTAILITTFLRDSMLYKAVESILPYLNENLILLIGDQGKITEEKDKFYLDLKLKMKDTVHFRQLPYNSGLSYGRNRLVELAKEKNCDYCLLSSDSFLFNKSIKKLNTIITGYSLFHYDLLAFDLEGSTCGWEAKINLIPNKWFELDFIEKNMKHSQQDNFELYNCEIARNFFVAKTDSLIDCKWLEELKLGEHELFFWNYKQKSYRVGWTNLITATKMKERPNEYADLRRMNFNEGIATLKKKFNLEKWVVYKNLENSKLDKDK